MTNVKWKLWGTCFACKKNKFFIRLPTVKVPQLPRVTITGRELTCRKCTTNLQNKLNAK